MKIIAINYIPCKRHCKLYYWVLGCFERLPYIHRHCCTLFQKKNQENLHVNTSIRAITPTTGANRPFGPPHMHFQASTGLLPSRFRGSLLAHVFCDSNIAWKSNWKLHTTHSPDCSIARIWCCSAFTRNRSPCCNMLHPPPDMPESSESQANYYIIVSKCIRWSQACVASGISNSKSGTGGTCFRPVRFSACPLHAATNQWLLSPSLTSIQWEMVIIILLVLSKGLVRGGSTSMTPDWTLLRIEPPLQNVFLQLFAKLNV